MTQILEYISQNYILFLIALVLILLAFIGYYADKTNFGQGKIKDKALKQNVDEEKGINTVVEMKKESSTPEVVESVNEKSTPEVSIEIVNNESPSIEDVGTITKEPMPEVSTESINNESVSTEDAEIINNKSILDETMNEVDNSRKIVGEELKDIELNEEISNKKNIEEESLFDNEIDYLLPKKELINEDLLEEIEGMDFKSIKQKKSFELPNIDDISLPKIKNLVESEQDIWKF